MADTSPTPKKRGCFFYGCLTLIILGLIVGIMGFVVFRYATSKLINEYTDTAPASIETVEISSSQLAELQQRIADFADAIKNQKIARELELTAEEINGLIASDPNYK